MSEDTHDTDFTPPELEEIGQLLPAYEMHHFIAKGGMGAVYMARQRSLERDVAIKILPRHFGEDADFRASFEAEAKSMAKLNHPNLISIYDFGQVDGMLYIIMEMVQGKSLYHSAYGKTIDPAEAARIVIEICHGLANAHKHGILHRDIKPANILLAPDASPKIGDFGLARPVGETDSGLSYGTPGYSAPEVVHNPAAVDQSTDLYSVGVILYELLTSHLPASSYSPAASEVDCDPGYDRVIRKATHPTPALRYRDANSMARDLQKVIDNKPTNNPLLVKADSKPSSATAKTLLTSSKAAVPNKLKTGNSSNDKPSLKKRDGSSSSKSTSSNTHSSSSKSSTPPTTHHVGSNAPLIRNIIIIIALLAAIYIAWEGYKVHKAKREAEQAAINEEKADRDREAKEKRDLEQKEKQAAIKAMQDKHKQPVGKTPDYLKPKDETPLEMLNRLKSALLLGQRNEMPKSTIKSGDRYRFYISIPMTWNDAQQFSEEHGGHLAIFPESSALQTFTTNINSDESIWLGAGTAGDNTWRWIDGTPWKQKIRNTSKASFVSVDDTGILKPQLPQTKLPFFIEWMADGSSPATLEMQLRRCAESISSGSPEYPAGTASYDNRYYLHVERMCDWQTARELASTGKGVLAVPSNADESVWINSFIADRKQAGQSCWIGGIHPANSSWQWSTGEAWSFAHWKSGAPDDNTNDQLACAVNAAGEWDDHTSDTLLGSFLIEWSKDAEGLKSIKTQKTISSNPIAPVRAKCAKLLISIQKRYKKDFYNNIKGFEQELSVYKRNLVHSQQKAYTPIILEMQSRYRSGKIPDDMPRLGLSPELLKLLDSRVERQKRIQEKCDLEIDSIRTKYRANLLKLSAQFKSQGLASRVKKVQDELNNTKVSAQNFSDYILGQ
ncbi:MAG: protein kinase [Akkermansiaceae bacterium]